jgi:hypothetical protein
MTRDRVFTRLDERFEAASLGGVVLTRSILANLVG